MTIKFDFLAGLNVSFEYPAILSRYTTFQLGGPCPCAITCTSPEILQQAINEFRDRHIPFVMVGYGSNLLISDKGINVPVIRYVNEVPIIEKVDNDIVVAACTMLDDVVSFAARQGLAGINFTSGIPGTVGGAIVGNAGAFGKQIGDVVHSVDIICPDGNMQHVTGQELGFRYRHSRLKTSGEIILSARLRLNPVDSQKLLSERTEILDLRRNKHPDYKATPTAGSFFRNIEPTSQAEKRQAAGWFLEQAGAKDMACGGAKLFHKHANIIVKGNDHCTAQDVYNLSCAMTNAVRKKFNFNLEREVVLLGEFTGGEYNPAKICW